MIDIKTICAQGIQEWKQTKQCRNLSAWKVAPEEQCRYEEKLDQLMKDLSPFLDAFPKQVKAQKIWKQRGQAYIEGLLKEEDVLLISDMKEEHRTLFQEITISFLKDVRTFDPSLSISDTMQAMRNVWIIAILQCIFDRPVGYHKAMFAYSMLYPYSDNYLDDVQVSMQEKCSFNAWFTQRLKGEVFIGRNHHEEKISTMVGLIESQFPRHLYPQVYEGLLLIQNAQILSLSQQDGATSNSQEALLAISYEKGGTSVVADGVLIQGSLTQEELRFCMQYGFMLQLGDDLQDIVEDRLQHHQTILSTWHQGELDDLVCKLIQYTMDILQPSTLCEDQALLHFVCKDCLYLLFLAIAQEDPILVSPSLYQDVLSALPLSYDYMRKMKQEKQFHYSDQELWERIDTLIS